ncbi:MAG: hypothetical protein CMC79_02850 [Flavobacteriaceae bacterium]|nr:hypothetical protein [Flavobacteriaceae bacterium]
MDVKFFIGPMSKNVVDTIIDFQKETKEKVGFIPSRRQVEYNGGYSNNWTTAEFCKYATNHLLVRDHAGPGQGNVNDDGYESLSQDSNYFDIIHVDPWKQYPKYKDGLKWSINMINFCFSKNKDIIYEVGTEEAIRKFEVNELDNFILDLKKNLNTNVFKKIRYLVIQSGTSLSIDKNTGVYDKKRLKRMIELSKKHNLISKEHNGDYISENIILEKMNEGLDSINIAPEFGLIETQTYLDNIQDKKTFDLFWKICFESNKWIKWVPKNFNPLKEKETLIKISAHYIFSNSFFIKEIKNKLPEIDIEIRKNIYRKLNKLYGY